jgi:hypothetical protein
MSRSFTVEKIETSSGKKKGSENLGGRFISSTPAGAARKVGSKVCRSSNVKGQCTLYVTIRETTQGSNHKEFTYKVKRILDPVTIERNGVEITYRYRTIAKAC